jgi:hypothetical protein
MKIHRSTRAEDSLGVEAAANTRDEGSAASHLDEALDPSGALRSCSTARSPATADEIAIAERALRDATVQERQNLARFAYLLADFDEQGLHLARGFEKVGLYGVHAGIVRTPREGQDLVRIVRRLGGLPGFRAAFVDGSLDWRTIKSVLPVVQAHNEAHWLALALRLSPNELELEVARARGRAVTVIHPRHSKEQTLLTASTTRDDADTPPVADAPPTAAVEAIEAMTPPPAKEESLPRGTDAQAPSILTSAHSERPVPAAPAEGARFDGGPTNERGEITRAGPSTFAGTAIRHGPDDHPCSFPGCSERAEEAPVRAMHAPGGVSHAPLCRHHRPVGPRDVLSVEGTVASGLRFVLVDGSVIRVTPGRRLHALSQGAA